VECELHQTDLGQSPMVKFGIQGDEFSGSITADKIFSENVLISFTDIV
jgi:hypothetical protein